MKAVAPPPLLVEGIGKCERLLDLRRGAVKSGVEARYLRQLGIELHHHLNWREVVRFVRSAPFGILVSTAVLAKAEMRKWWRAADKT